jgi:hypothetical protein
MPKPPPLGTINGVSVCNARIGRKKFTFDGTLDGLTRAATRNGAVIGTTVHADFGGYWRKMKIISAPHDRRAGGFWVHDVHQKTALNH